VTCEDVREEAAALAALPPEAPERRQAQLHAAACPECARALEQAERLQALLLATGADPTPAVGPLARARAAVGAELRLARAARPWTAAGLGVAAAGAGTLGLLLAHQRDGGAEAIAAALGLGLCATVAAVAGAVRPVLAAALGAGIALAFAAIVGRGDLGSVAGAPGWACSSEELAAALLPLAGAAAVVWRGWLPPSALAPAAAAGALAGEAALHLTCHAPRTEAHLVIFHAGAVILAAVIGAVIGEVWRRRPA